MLKRSVCRVRQMISCKQESFVDSVFIEHHDNNHVLKDVHVFHFTWKYHVHVRTYVTYPVHVRMKYCLTNAFYVDFIKHGVLLFCELALLSCTPLLMVSMLSGPVIYSHNIRSFWSALHDLYTHIRCFNDSWSKTHVIDWAKSLLTALRGMQLLWGSYWVSLYSDGCHGHLY